MQIVSANAAPHLKAAVRVHSRGVPSDGRSGGLVAGARFEQFALRSFADWLNTIYGRTYGRANVSEALVAVFSGVVCASNWVLFEAYQDSARLAVRSRVASFFRSLFWKKSIVMLGCARAIAEGFSANIVQRLSIARHNRRVAVSANSRIREVFCKGTIVLKLC
jgi:hypothetical protein